jgi:hypothetical protein
MALAGCGGAPLPEVVTAAPDVPQGPAPCPVEGEVRLGRVCWNPVGSRWRVAAAAPGGEYAFDVELLPAHRLRATDHPAAGPASDEWMVERNTLRLFLANRFVEYRGELTNGSVVVGDAENVNGDSWSWRGDRAVSASPCREGEAAVASSCFSLAGTQWVLRAGAAETTIHFDAEGRLLTDQGSAPTDRWTQAGTTLRFAFGGVERTATLGSDTEHLAGEGWTAERLTLFAPPIH